MKKNLGFILVLTSLFFEMLYGLMSHIPFLIMSPKLLELLKFMYNPYMIAVFTIFKILLIIGIFLLLNEKSIGKRIGIAITMFLLMFPYILAINFDVRPISGGISSILLYLSSLVGFTCLLLDKKQLRYLVIDVQIVILMALNILTQLRLIDGFFKTYAVVNIIMPIGIVFFFALSSKLNPKTWFNMLEDDKKLKVIKRVKKISLATMIIFLLIGVQSMIRTENHDIIFESRESAEYERYSNEELHLEVKLSPIMFNLYFVHGDIIIEEDRYKVNSFIVMDYFDKDKDYLNFDFRSKTKNEDERISLDVRVFGDKESTIFRDIFVYLSVYDKENKTTHTESLSY